MISYFSDKAFWIYAAKLQRPSLRQIVFLCLLCLASHLSLSATPARGADKEITIIAYGDSLTAGFRLPGDKAFPAQLEEALRAKGHNVRVINAGVSGDTASGGLARLDWSLPEEGDAVILELGANDALRGIDPKITQKALDTIIQKLKAKGYAVLLTGMKAPLGFGLGYVRSFSSIFTTLAKKHDLILYPFFLEGVALKPKLSLPDGLHPNAEGVAVITKNILPSVEKLIKQVQTRAKN